jgi:hypothetical protein
LGGVYYHLFLSFGASGIYRRTGLLLCRGQVYTALLVVDGFAPHCVTASAQPTHLWLKRPTFISSVHRLQGEDSAGTSTADDEVRNTLQASLQLHIATMSSTSTVDAPTKL